MHKHNNIVVVVVGLLQCVVNPLHMLVVVVVVGNIVLTLVVVRELCIESNLYY